MTQEADDFSYWRAALAGRAPAVHADSPQCGYYKTRNGTGYEPVAIWKKDGQVICRVGASMRDAGQVWTWCAVNPISKEIAKAVFDSGQWPDMPTETPRSNMPSDPFESLMAEIGDKTAQAEALLAKGDAQTERDANLARNIQKQLLAMITRADDMHTSEKDPSLHESRRVDAKFAFRKSVKSVADRLRGAFEAFMRKEEARLKAEAQAKYEAERRAVENARKSVAEAQAKKLRDDPIAALTSEPEPLPNLPPPPEAVKVQVGGGYGSKSGLKSEWRAEIENYGAVASYFIAHPDMKALIEKLATNAVKAAKGAISITGVKVVETRKAI